MVRVITVGSGRARGLYNSACEQGQCCLPLWTLGRVVDAEGQSFVLTGEQPREASGEGL